MFSLKIENYRSFKQQNFNFSKINILIGENSSGKSSLLKLLIALKQTMQIPANRETLLALTGELVDMGNYKENIYYHNDELPIKLRFGFDKKYNTYFESFFSADKRNKKVSNEEVKKVRKLINGPITTKTFLNVIFNKNLDNHEAIKLSVENSVLGKLEINFEKKGKRTSHEIYFGDSCQISFYDKQFDEKYELNNIAYDKDGFLSLASGINLSEGIQKSLGIPELKKNKKVIPKEIEAKSQALFHKIAFLLVTQNYLKYLLQSIEYINPLNNAPSRIYLDHDHRQNKEISGIADVINYFSKNDSETKKHFKKFISILHEIGIVDDIEILKDNRLPVKEMRVKIKDLVSNILDVGYGVSLQLPLILKALLSEENINLRNNILLIEQPEVHLHPKLHAKLIEALVKLTTNTVYFIETHSEHIVRKLQVLVKDETCDLNSEDVTIHYFVRENKQSIVSIHKIDKLGLLQPKFPSGFFDNSYLLSKALLN